MSPWKSRYSSGWSSVRTARWLRCGVGRDALRDGPGGERAVVLQPQVPVQRRAWCSWTTKRCAAPPRRRASPARLGRGVEVALGAVAVQAVAHRVQDVTGVGPLWVLCVPQWTPIRSCSTKPPATSSSSSSRASTTSTRRRRCASASTRRWTAAAASSSTSPEPRSSTPPCSARCSTRAAARWRPSRASSSAWANRRARRAADPRHHRARAGAAGGAAIATRRSSTHAPESRG